MSKKCFSETLHLKSFSTIIKKEMHGCWLQKRRIRETDNISPKGKISRKNNMAISTPQNKMACDCRKYNMAIDNFAERRWGL